jgi:hypothetical protein
MRKDFAPACETKALIEGESMDTGNSGTMSEQAVDAPAEGRAAWPPDRTRDASLDVGCDPHRCHDQCRGFRNSRLGPGRTLTPPAPAALRQMAPDVVCDALRVPRSSRCTPPETPAAVHDSIALQGIYLTVRVPVDTHKAVETVETDPRVFDIEAALESSWRDKKCPLAPPTVRSSRSSPYL